jgi:hypothetical protein
VKVNVSDGNGGYAETSWTLTIENLNQGPSVEITAPAAGSRTFTEGDSIAFSSVGTDNDGDTLTYVWSSDRVFEPIGNDQTFTATLAAGTHVITLRVDDGHGGEARTNITVIVHAKDTGPNGDNTMVLVAGVGIAVAAAAGAGVFLMRRGKKPQ